MAFTNILSLQKFSFPSYAAAPGVDEGILNCTSGIDITPSKLYQNSQLCLPILDCVLGYASQQEQAQFSSAATVLGLLPTALSLMACSTDELLRVHTRFPILAFLMSLCNPSTISAAISSSPAIIEPAHGIRSPRLRKHLKTGISKRFTIRQVSIPLWLHDLVLHLIALGCTFMIFTQALLVGVRGVISYACWTSHNPLTWVCVGGVTHLLRIITWRLTLGPVTGEEEGWFKHSPRWHWNLSSHTASRLKLRHVHVARFLAVFFQVVGVMNYGYGTLQFSGFTLVGAYFAIRTFTLIGFSSLVSRLIAIWVLEVYPDEIVESAEAKGVGMISEEEVTSDKHTVTISVR